MSYLVGCIDKASTWYLKCYISLTKNGRISWIVASRFDYYYTEFLYRRPNLYSRDQILRRERRQGKVMFLYLADHEQDWQPYPVDPYSAIVISCGYRYYTYNYHEQELATSLVATLLTWLISTLF